MSFFHRTYFVSIPDRAYLAAKAEIDHLREQYGPEDWLHSQAGDRVNDLLGIVRTDPRSTDVIVAEKLLELQGKKDDIDKFVQQAAESLGKAGCYMDMTLEDQYYSLEEDQEDSVLGKGLGAIEEDEDAANETTEENLEKKRSGKKKSMESNAEMSSSFYNMYKKADDSGDTEGSTDFIVVEFEIALYRSDSVLFYVFLLFLKLVTRRYISQFPNTQIT